VRQWVSVTTIDAAFVAAVLANKGDDPERLVQLAQALRQARRMRM